MRNDNFFGWYIGQRKGDPDFRIRHIGWLGVDQGWGEVSVADATSNWPFGQSENYTLW